MHALSELDSIILYHMKSYSSRSISSIAPPTLYVNSAVSTNRWAWHLLTTCFWSHQQPRSSTAHIRNPEYIQVPTMTYLSIGAFVVIFGVSLEPPAYPRYQSAGYLAIHQRVFTPRNQYFFSYLGTIVSTRQLLLGRYNGRTVVI